MSPSTISCSTSAICGSESRGPGGDGGSATGPAAASVAGGGKGGVDGAAVDASPSGAGDNCGSATDEAPPVGNGRPSQAVTATAIDAPNTTALARPAHRFILPKVIMGYPAESLHPPGSDGFGVTDTSASGAPRRGRGERHYPKWGPGSHPNGA